MNASYGYGHTKEASAIVRNELKTQLAREIKKYGLKISVRKADSGYGGPRVTITTSDPRFTDYYEYIVDANGNTSDIGTLVRVTASEFGGSNVPWRMAQLKRAREYNPDAKALHAKVLSIVSKFGKDDDDVMTDYFNNTMPLFYGVEYNQ